MYANPRDTSPLLGGYVGLGALLPVVGTDQWAASILPETFVQARWAALQEGVTLGAKSGRVWDRASHEDYAFRLAVRDGFFPNTYEGYRNFLRWNSAGSAQRIAMGADGAAFDAFMRNWMAKALQVQPQIDAYLASQKAKGVWIGADPLAPFIADPWLGLGGTIPSFTAPVTTTTTTPVNTSTGFNGRVLQFQYTWTVGSGYDSLFNVVAYRVVTITNGRASYGAWTAVGPWVVRMTAQEAGSQNANSGWFAPAMVKGTTEPVAPTSQWLALVNAGEPAALAFLKTLPFAVAVPATWGQPIGSWIAGTPAPAPIPYVPGSTVRVPVPGSGEKPVIQLPGSQEWTDATAPEIMALNQNKPDVQTMTPTRGGGDLQTPVLDFGGGSSGGGNRVTTGAGGNAGMLLLLGGAALLFFAGKRGKR